VAIAVVAGALANKPNSGGEAWVRLSWVLGLMRLGLDVYFVEEIDTAACVDSEGAASAFGESANVDHFERVTQEFGLQARSALLLVDGEAHRGLDRARVGELLADADLLFNISGHLEGPLLDGPRSRVYVDLDPGFTQAWHADPSLPFSVAGHDHHLTVGQRVGSPGCPIPTGGLRWIPFLPPVLLDEWASAPVPGGVLTLTTVSTWRSPHGGVEISGRAMGLKHHQFRRFAALPEMVDGVEFEIALDIHPGDSEDLDLLRAHGWRVVDPLPAAGTPRAFRDFVRRSGAEFSVAQGAYVEASSGWFSDRTAAYLASGRPAVVQDTGLRGELLTSSALTSFADLEGAVAAVGKLPDGYRERSAAARELACTHLDSDRVLGRVLEAVLPGLILLLVAMAALVGAAGAQAAMAPRVEVVSPPQTVFDWAESACEPNEYPDLPARAFRDFEGQTQLLISHFDNFRLIGPSLDQLSTDCSPVMLSPRSASPKLFEDRRWIASIFTADGRTVWALVHDEYQGNRHPGRCPSHLYLHCWYNAVTLARSDDGGHAYTQARPPGQLVASAPFRYRPDSGPAGVFAPSNIVTGSNGARYALVRIREPGRRRGTCLIRTWRIRRAGSWRAWNGSAFGGRFTDPYLTGARPHIPCAPVGRGAISEMDESLTYNTVLGAYLLVGLAPPGAATIGPEKMGIYFSTSTDLIHWSERKLVTAAVTPHNYVCGGLSPLAYPSVIDPESASRTFATSGGHPYLYYTQFRYRDCRQTPERDLMRVSLQVSP
jgi:hypothetical protein